MKNSNNITPLRQSHLLSLLGIFLPPTTPVINANRANPVSKAHIWSQAVSAFMSVQWIVVRFSRRQARNCGYNLWHGYLPTIKLR